MVRGGCVVSGYCRCPLADSPESGKRRGNRHAGQKRSCANHHDVPRIIGPASVGFALMSGDAHRRPRPETGDSRSDLPRIWIEIGLLQRIADESLRPKSDQSSVAPGALWACTPRDFVMLSAGCPLGVSGPEGTPARAGLLQTPLQTVTKHLTPRHRRGTAGSAWPPGWNHSAGTARYSSMGQTASSSSGKIGRRTCSKAKLARLTLPSPGVSTSMWCFVIGQ